MLTPFKCKHAVRIAVWQHFWRKMSKNPDTAQFVNILIKMADAMLKCGAEIYRAEDTLHRIAYAYGAEEIDVFAITSNIWITLKMPGEDAFTQSKRFKTFGSHDFEKLERLNALSRRVCAEQTELCVFEYEIDQILKPDDNRMAFIVGSVLATGGFALFFDGSWAEALIAGVIGVFVCILQTQLAPICLNRMFLQLATAFITGIVTCILVRLAPGVHLDRIMVGVIMLLIPGIMFTNSMRDMLLGDTLSGSLRLIEAMLLALLLTLGLLAAIMIMNYLW